MPEMNGYEVCKRFKENPQTHSIPVIFLSALDDVFDKVQAFQVGGVDFITKPFYFEEVLVRIKTQLTIQHLQSQLQTQNAQLQQALNEIKEAQALMQRKNIVCSEQLVDGVAGASNKSNNTTNFNSVNLTLICESIQALLTIIITYQHAYPNPPLAAKQALEEVDLDLIILGLKNLVE